MRSRHREGRGSFRSTGEIIKVMYLPITDISLLKYLFLHSNECKFCCCQY